MRFNRGANVRFHFCALEQPLLPKARQRCRDISFRQRTGERVNCPTNLILTLATPRILIEEGGLVRLSPRSHFDKLVPSRALHS